MISVATPPSLALPPEGRGDSVPFVSAQSVPSPVRGRAREGATACSQDFLERIL